MHISLIIPVYNDSGVIYKTLDKLVPYLTSCRLEYEIILVDDGSRDGTVKMLEDFTKGKANIRILRNVKNTGKGAAVRKGMLEASGDYIFFTDADLSAPVEEIGRFVEAINEDTDILIGIRDPKTPGTLVTRSLYRRIISKIYTHTVNLLFGTNVEDINCGFKCFSQKASKIVFGRQLINRWTFDAEIIYIARKHNLRILEIPISWKDHLPSHVNILKDAAVSLVDLLKILTYKSKKRYL